MKKILTVIIVCMLTCVMCIVLFACNNTQNQNEPDSADSAIGGVYNDREGQFENYMASTEFSFGEMRWEYMNLYFNNQSFIDFVILFLVSSSFILTTSLHSHSILL